jgi:hypothetical protein
MRSLVIMLAASAVLAIIGYFAIQQLNARFSKDEETGEPCPGLSLTYECEIAEGGYLEFRIGMTRKYSKRSVEAHRCHALDMPASTRRVFPKNSGGEGPEPTTCLHKPSRPARTNHKNFARCQRSFPTPLDILSGVIEFGLLGTF